MKEMKRDKARREYTLIMALGVILTFLMLVGMAGAVPFAYVVNSGDDTVSVIDTATDTVTATVPVGEFPMGVAVSPDESKVYVTNYGSGANLCSNDGLSTATEVGTTVSVIDAATNTVVDTITVGKHPYDVVVSPDSKKVYVTNAGDATVSVINAVTNTVSDTISNIGELPYSNPMHIVITPDGSTIYVQTRQTFDNSNMATVYVINTTNNSIVDTIGIRNADGGITMSQGGNCVYTVHASAGTDSVKAFSVDYNNPIDNFVVNVDECPREVAVSPDDATLYVVNYVSDTISVVNSTAGVVMYTIDMNDPDHNSGIENIAVSTDGKKLYVVSSSNFRKCVYVFNSTATNYDLITTIPVGKYAGEIAIKQEPTVAIVHPEPTEKTTSEENTTTAVIYDTLLNNTVVENTDGASNTNTVAKEDNGGFFANIIKAFTNLIHAIV